MEAVTKAENVVEQMAVPAFAPITRTIMEPCRIITLEELFTKTECAEIVSMGTACRAREAEVTMANVIGVQQNVRHLVRRNAVAWLPPEQGKTEWMFTRINAAAKELNSQLWGYDLSFIAPLQFSVYKLGDHFDWHTDVGPGDISVRKLSFSVQLSEPKAYVGGSLRFRDGQRAGRTAGSCTIFPSFLLHRVTPILWGTRLALVGWINGTEPLR